MCCAGGCLHSLSLCDRVERPSVTSPGHRSSWRTFLPAGGKSGHPSPAVLAGPSRDSCSLEGWGGGQAFLSSGFLCAASSRIGGSLCTLGDGGNLAHSCGARGNQTFAPNSSPDLWSQINPVSDTMLQILTLGEKLPINCLCLGPVRPRVLPGIQLPLGSPAV